MKNIYFYIVVLFAITLGCAREIEPILIEDQAEESTIKELEDGTQLRFTNLGPQLFNTDISTATFYEDNTGRKYLYAVVAGEPAYLLGYNLSDNNKLITNIPLPSGNTSNSIEVSSDGIVYITGGGRLFSHTINTSTIQDLGVVLSSQTSLYGLNAGKDGVIYGGTYPGGRVFRYSPQIGFTDLGNGAMSPDRAYVRSMVYHEGLHRIYAGMGTGAQLIEFDLTTGTKKNILPANYADQEFTYQLELVEGVDGGDRLFITLQNINMTLIYNIATGEYEHEVSAIWVPGAIKSSINNTVYYTRGNSLYAFDNIPAGNFDQRKVTTISGNARSSILFGNVLHLFTNLGQLVRYDLSTNTTTTSQLDIPGQPRQLNDVHVGPGNRVWTSGYQYGDNAVYDIVTKETTPMLGLSQTESAALYEETIYFGSYTRARMYKYNTRLPWRVGSNPKLIATVPGQDRPFAGLPVPSLGKVFFGTVPTYGSNGGVLVEFDVKNNDQPSYHTVVDGQSIISLTEQGGKLFGGTSIWGGLGSTPIASEAKLFVWDIASGQKVHEVVPVSGARFISCLINGHDGYIWGIAQGYLFKIDPEDYSIVYSTQIYNDGRASFVWRPDRLVLSPRDHMYYGSIGSNMFRLNPETLAVDRLNEVGGHLTLGPDGAFYFIRASNLWKMEVR